MNQAQFAALFPGVPSSLRELYCTSLTLALERYGMDGHVLREAAFVAQVGHESLGLTRLEENLHYSADRLFSVFPRHFLTLGDARAVAGRGPEAVANRVYAGRMGNGTEDSGDGWRYRGRGPLQVTGRAMYATMGEALMLPLRDEPDLLLEIDNGLMAAGEFWRAHGLNRLADKGELELMTHRINGGMAGFADRMDRYVAALKVLA